VRGLSAERRHYGSARVILVKRVIARHSENSPTFSSLKFIAFPISFCDLVQFVYTAVDFDNQLRFQDCEIDHVGSDWMLAPDSEIMRTQLAKSCPCPLFRKVRGFSQTPRAPDC